MNGADGPHGLTLGAYAAAGGLDRAAEAGWYEALARIDGAGGLEVPFTGTVHPGGASHADGHAHAAGAMHPLGAAHLAALVPQGWHLVLTLLPMTVGIGRSDPDYGLASGDESGRRRAVADALAAREAIATLHERLGRAATIAVQLNSAPTRDPLARADASALRRSLIELAGLDWAGAELVVEHCDAAVPGSAWQKGYLTLAEETEAVIAAGGPAAGLGQSVNWGRSAIEGRSAATALEHLAATREAGTLRGLMFSGAAGTDGPYGTAWRDVHNPVREVDAHSLLGGDEIAAALALVRGARDGAAVGVAADRDTPAGDAAALRFVGVKVKGAPGARSLDERMTPLAQTARIVAQALDDLAARTDA
jgi:hypothetical protein